MLAGFDQEISLNEPTNKKRELFANRKSQIFFSKIVNTRKRAKDLQKTRKSLSLTHA